jgi:S1-C subfamily serine protease
LISHVARKARRGRRLLVGDVIVGFAGESVQDPEELVTRLRGNRIGAAVPITVIRGTAAVDVTVTVAERPTTRG